MVYQCRILKNPINNFTDILIFTRSVLDWKRLGSARFLTGLEHRGNKPSTHAKEKDGRTKEEKEGEIPLNVGRKVRARKESETSIRRRRRYNKLKSSTAVVNTWKKEENERTPDAKEEEKEESGECNSRECK